MHEARRINTSGGLFKGRGLHFETSEATLSKRKDGRGLVAALHFNEYCIKAFITQGNFSNDVLVSKNVKSHLMDACGLKMLCKNAYRMFLQYKMYFRLFYHNIVRKMLLG